MLEVKGAVINLIFPDLNRAPWTFHNIPLNCLRNGECPYKGGFQGFDFSTVENDLSIRQSVLIASNKTIKDAPIRNGDGIKEFSKSIAKQSMIVTNVYKFLRQFVFNTSATVIDNFNAISDIAQMAKQNVIINIISTKSINSTNFSSSPPNVEFIHFLNKRNYRYNWCDINKGGFRKNDDHPNQRGYVKVRECTSNAISVLKN